MNNIKYIKSGDAVYAVNLKAASSAILKAIAETHYPEVVDLIVNKSSYPEGVEPMARRVHGALPHVEDPDGPVVLIVRDPVERFRSACGEIRMTADKALDSLESGGFVNRHLLPTSRLLRNGVHLYRYETDLQEAVTALGLEYPLPEFLSTGGEKPDLTPEQLARVQAIYADDIALYNSITEPGQIYNTSHIPISTKDKDHKRQELSFARHQAVNGGMVFNGIPVRTDDQTRTELAIARQFAKENSELTIEWKLGNGSFITLNSDTIISLSDAVLAHQQSQFSREKELNALVDSANTADELSTIKW